MITPTRRRLHAPAFWLFLLLALRPGWAEDKPGLVGMSGSRLERLTQVMQGYVDAGQLAGAVVRVACDGQVAYFRAFGQADIEAGRAMQRDTIFRIASQTKALVSVGVMLLQEEGRLLIDDPVADYLSEFAHTTVAVAGPDSGYVVVDAARPITIRDLLTHTAGIGYGGALAADRWRTAGIQGWYFAHRQEPIRDTVARLAGLPFEAQPGTRFVYGYSSDILGALIEVVAGEPLDVFLRTRIFEPLGMQDTHFYLPPGKAARLAAVYAAGEDGGLVRAPEESTMEGQGAYVDGPRLSFSGGAGLLSTAADYGRFLEALLYGGTLDGRRILSPKTVELMTVDHLGKVEFPRGQGAGFGLGFRVTKDLGASGLPGSVGAYGWGGAYHTTYWVDPVVGLVVVYMTQLIPARGLDDHAKLRALVYQAVTE